MPQPVMAVATVLMMCVSFFKLASSYVTDVPISRTSFRLRS